MHLKPLLLCLAHNKCSINVNEYVYLGTVEEVQPGMNGAVSTARITQKNKFCVGDTIEIMKSDGRNVSSKVLSLTTQDGEEVSSAPHSKQILYVGLDAEADKYDLLRVKG